MSKLKPEQVLYFDTDSIIFSQGEGEPILPLGDYLEEFTSELKQGDNIVEFASAGPKNYGYCTKEGKVECKVRGFMLNMRGQEQLNFDFLKENVINEVTKPHGRTMGNSSIHYPQNEMQRASPRVKGCHRNQMLQSHFRQVSCRP